MQKHGVKEATHKKVTPFYLYETSGKNKSIETESRTLVAWGCGGRNDGWLQIGLRKLFGDDGNVLKADDRDGCKTL